VETGQSKHIGFSEETAHFLDDTYTRFHKPEFLQTDPLWFVRQYSRPQDQELVALLCACLSYGSFKVFKSVIERLLGRLSRAPSSRLSEMSSREIKMLTQDVYYRFYTPSDLASLLISLRQALVELGSLENIVRHSGSPCPLDQLSELRRALLFYLPRKNHTYGESYLFADPYQGPAKRLHMFMRWMSRKDSIDLGIWPSVEAEHLLIPLDTHIFDLSRRLGLCKRKAPSLDAAIEITENLRHFCPSDPVKYDFSLCRVGMLGLKLST